MSIFGIDSAIETEIESLLRKLRHYNAASKEYSQIIDQIVKLKSTLTPENPDR